MKKILGLVGGTGSGKDTFCDYVKKISPNVFCFRFSQPLSEVLGIFFSDIKKEDQQWLATALRERFGTNILGEAIKKKIEGIKEGILVLNGIRMPEEAEMVRDIGGKIIYITADLKLRWERVQKRGEKKDDEVSYEKFLEIDNGIPERQIVKIGEQADFKIENNASLKDFYVKIEDVLEKI